MWTADADTTCGDAGVSWRTLNWVRHAVAPSRPATAVDGTGSSGGATERLGDLGSPDDPDTVFMP
jgi:hypothetical protein